MTETIEPRTFPTVRFLSTHDTDCQEHYEKLAYLIKKYGCPVTKVSDDLDWIRIYFEIPVTSKDAFLKEEKQK